MEYRVNWNIEVDADSPREAAIQARQAQIRPGSTAVVFTVETGNPQGPESVDLMELAQDGQYTEHFSPITDESDMATVLAALRLFQHTYEDCDSRTIAAAWPEHFQITGDGESDVNPPPLGTDDIDTLCEAINCTSSEPAEPAPNVNALLGAKLLEKFPWLADKSATDISGADTIQELTDLYESLKWEDEVAAPPTPRVVIVVEGGLLQDIITTAPIDVVEIDYDTDGADEEEIMQIPQDLPGMSENASLESTAAAVAMVRTAEVNPARANQLFEAIAIEPEPEEKQAPEN
jgi:hypothetical protein